MNAVERMPSDHLHREHCKYFPLKIWVNTSFFDFLAYISMLWEERLWMTLNEREREEGEWGLKRAKNEIEKRGKKRKREWEPSWRQAEREGGEMWEYVRNERYSDELFKAWNSTALERPFLLHFDREGGGVDVRCYEDTISHTASLP